LGAIGALHGEPVLAILAVQTPTDVPRSVAIPTTGNAQERSERETNY
jgi:hypothetical protein